MRTTTYFKGKTQKALADQRGVTGRGKMQAEWCIEMVAWCNLFTVHYKAAWSAMGCARFCLVTGWISFFRHRTAMRWVVRKVSRNDKA